MTLLLTGWGLDDHAFCIQLVLLHLYFCSWVHSCVVLLGCWPVGIGTVGIGTVGRSSTQHSSTITNHYYATVINLVPLLDIIKDWP